MARQTIQWIKSDSQSKYAVFSYECRLMHAVQFELQKLALIINTIVTAKKSHMFSSLYFFNCIRFSAVSKMICPRSKSYTYGHIKSQKTLIIFQITLALASKENENTERHTNKKHFTFISKEKVF